MALQLQTRRRTLQNPRFIQLFSSSFSSSSDSNGGDNKKESTTPSPSSSSSSSSYFSDVKASLKQNPPYPRRGSPSPPREFPSFSSVKPSNSSSSSLDEIRKNLAEFRRRSSTPPPPDQKPTQTISFQELYKRNVIEKKDEGGNSGGVGGTIGSGKLSFDSIRESLRQLRSSAGNQSQNDRFRGGGQDRGNNRTIDPYSLKSYRDSLKMRPDGSELGHQQSVVLGGTEVLPSSVFGKELGQKSESESPAMNTEFVKMYTYGELGEKLVKLRPIDNRKGFSLEELNDRLRKLREMEEKEMDSKIGGLRFKDLRESLMRMSTDEKAKKTSTMYRLDLLANLGGTPSFMMHPPKEDLVEKYFHPDNMSSEEKLKLELTKVREEFKMSESDCGSSRVQVAQLTTKIKHLSSVLHKKDKHSRKGLQAMVQRRKKLLKYLRRTDWDSYCLVLSKLGLRDNPDYKN